MTELVAITVLSRSKKAASTRRRATRVRAARDLTRRERGHIVRVSSGRRCPRLASLRFPRLAPRAPRARRRCRGGSVLVVLLVAERRLRYVGGRGRVRARARSRRAGAARRSRRRSARVLGLAADPEPGLRDWLADRAGGADRRARPARASTAGRGLAAARRGERRRRDSRPPKPAPRSRSRCADPRPTIVDRRPARPGTRRVARARRGGRRARDRGAGLLPRAAPRGARSSSPRRRPGVVFVDEPGRVARRPRRRERARSSRSWRTRAAAGVDRAGRRRRRARDRASPTRWRGRRATCCAASAGSTTSKRRERRSVRDRPLREALHRRLLASPFDPARVGTDELRARLDGRCCATRRRSSPTRRGRVGARRARRRRRRARPAASRCSPIPTINEIMVNGPDRVFVERARPARGGRRATSTPTRSCASPSASSRRSGCGSTAPSPMVDARLPDGSRLHAVLPPLAPDGPCLTIRRFGRERVGLADVRC